MMTIDTANVSKTPSGEALPFDLRQRSLKLPEAPPLRDCRVHGQVTRLDSYFLVQAEASATVTLACSRCLVEFPYRVNLTLAEEFANRPTEDQWLAGKTELDLRPMLRDLLLLALPDQPLHAKACQGLCPVCGQDLNQTPHRHRAVKPESPFVALTKTSKKL